MEMTVNSQDAYRTRTIKELRDAVNITDEELQRKAIEILPASKTELECGENKITIEEWIRTINTYSDIPPKTLLIEILDERDETYTIVTVGIRHGEIVIIESER